MGRVSLVQPAVTKVSGDGGAALVPQMQHWNDSIVDVSYLGFGNFIRKNSLARLRLTTSATGIFVSYVINGSNSNQGISVFSNGVLKGYISYPGDTNEHTSYVALPAGTKTIDIVEGAQTATDQTLGTIIGGYVTRVALTDSASALVTKAAPARRLVVYGDSIAAGFFASQSSNNGWSALLRSIYPGQVTVDAIGDRSLHYDVVTIGQSTTVANLSAELDGTAYNEIWLAMGYNDYGFNLYSAAAFQTAYGNLLDALHAARPSLNKIWCQTLIPTTNDGVANGSGNTPADYRTAVTNAVASRSAWATLVDGTTLVSVGALQDGIHPTTAGHATYYANVKALLGV